MKIRSWEDVDEGLGIIRESREVIAEARGKMSREHTIIGDLEQRIEAFVRDHEEDLQERSKSVRHGRVWLRSATRLVARSWAAVVARLKDDGGYAYLRIKEEADKEALAQADDAELAKFGVRRKTEDVFGYEVA